MKREKELKTNTINLKSLVASSCDESSKGTSIEVLGIAIAQIRKPIVLTHKFQIGPPKSV